MDLEAILDQLINNYHSSVKYEGTRDIISISKGKQDFFKKNLLNDRFDLFEKILNNNDLYAIPRSIVKYMNNPESIRKFLVIFDQMEVDFRNSKKHKLSYFRTGIINNKNLDIEIRAKTIMMTDIYEAKIPFLDEDILDCILALQSRITHVDFDQKNTAIIKECIRTNKGSFENLNKVIPLFVEEAHEYFHDTLVSDIIDHPESMKRLTASNLEMLLNALISLKNTTRENYSNNNHHMSKKKLERLENSLIKYRYLINNELKSRKDGDSLLTRLII